MTQTDVPSHMEKQFMEKQLSFTIKLGTIASV